MRSEQRMHSLNAGIVCWQRKLQRLPKRQAADTDEQRAEDAFARRWDRLLAEQESVNSELLSTYSGIFAASEMEEDDAHLAVCIAVTEFFQISQRLPKRQGSTLMRSEQRMHSLNAGIVCWQRKLQRLPKRQAADTDEQRAEDAFARRWDRLLAEKASVSEELLSTYSGIFAASEMEGDDAHLAVCIAANKIFKVPSLCQSGKESTLMRSEQRMHSLDAGIVCWQRKLQ